MAFASTRLFEAALITALVSPQTLVSVLKVGKVTIAMFLSALKLAAITVTALGQTPVHAKKDGLDMIARYLFARRNAKIAVSVWLPMYASAINGQIGLETAG